MIVDKIENAHLYSNLSERLAKALEILKDKGLAEKKEGRYEVEGDKLYYFVQRYQSRPLEEGKFEAHKKYIDIQFVASGQEALGYAPTEELKAQIDYAEDGDYRLYDVPDKFTAVRLTAGSFAILFSDDGHMPGSQSDGPCDVTKVVLKVKIDE